MKKCKDCNLEKNKNEFSNCKTGKEGLSARCKECSKIKTKIYRNKDSSKEYMMNWKLNNKDLKAKLDKDYYLRNKDIILNYKKEWDKYNFEKNKEYYKNRFQNERSYYYALFSQKRRIKRQTKLTKEEKENMRLIYECAQWASLVVGEKVEVDHIIPLSKGGLHHPDNLQIVTKKYNRQKSNKLI